MLDRCLRAIITICSICVLLLAQPSQAQDASAYPALYSSPAFRQSVMQKVNKPALSAAMRCILGNSAPPSASSVVMPTPGLQKASLEYEPIEGISHTLRQQIASGVIAYDPHQGVQLRQILATDTIAQQFEQLQASIGFSSRNLADVMTSYYVSSWEIVNRSVAERGFIYAVRNRLAYLLRRSPEIILMSETEKQRTAESLGIMTTVAQTAGQNLLQQNDQIGYVALQVAVHESLLQQGLDLKHLSLTNYGFMPNG